jgi:hypothetical protein
MCSAYWLVSPLTGHWLARLLVLTRAAALVGCWLHGVPVTRAPTLSQRRSAQSGLATQAIQMRDSVHEQMKRTRDTRFFVLVSTTTHHE